LFIELMAVLATCVKTLAASIAADPPMIESPPVKVFGRKHTPGFRGRRKTGVRGARKTEKRATLLVDRILRRDCYGLAREQDTSDVSCTRVNDYTP
jgi:hypothetical protein